MAAPLLALLLVFSLLWLVRIGEQPATALPAAAPAPAAVPVQPTLAPTAVAAAPVVARPSLPSGAAMDADSLVATSTATDAATVAADAVAIVNGAALTPAAFAELRVIDAVMAALAGQPPSTPTLLLEQWVNSELVWQRATETGLPAIDADSALDLFLAQVGRRRADLDDTLAAAQISPPIFADYWRRLVVAQQFVQEQAAAQQVDAGAYIQRLQQAARISFGPDAGPLLAAPTPALPVSAAAVETAAEPAAPAAATATTATAAAAEPTTAEPLPEQRGVEVGMLAPEFVLATMADDASSLALDDLRGQPTVLSFWTTWCPYCLRQTPVMVEAYARTADEGIQFVGIDVQEDRNTVATYLAQHQIEYPILLDEQGSIAAEYAVQGYPTTYFLDSDNRIVARNIGALTGEQLNTYLQMLSPPGQGP